MSGYADFLNDQVVMHGKRLLRRDAPRNDSTIHL